MEKQYIRTVVILPFDIQYFTVVLFLFWSSAKLCVLCRSTAKKTVRKKYGRIALVFSWLNFFRTSALFFCDFS